MPDYCWMSATYDKDKIYMTDLLAGILGVSRSEIMRRALDEFISKHLGELVGSINLPQSDRIAVEP